MARLLHNRSARTRAPFVDLNCAGLSKELLESELFGHERGAFTNAMNTKPGLFEIAADGTLFLDEIGEMDLTVQARLLKAIEEKSSGASAARVTSAPTSVSSRRRTAT